MSKMNKPGPSGVVKGGGIPKAPPMPKPSTSTTNSSARGFLNKSDTQGGHNSLHVGQTANQLTARNKSTATSFLGKADQNMAARSTMNSTGAQNTRNQVANGKMNNKQAVTVPQSGGRLSPIAKVAIKDPKTGKTDTFNAKVTSSTMVLKKGPQGVRAQTTFAETGTRLPKPLPGGQVPNSKVAIGAIGPGAQGQLRKVGAPAPKGPNLATDHGVGTQKKFAGMTKNATGVTKPGQKK